MSFKPLKKIILAAAVTLSCAFNTEAQVAHPFTGGHVHLNTSSLPGDTVYKNLDKNGVLVSIERYTDGNLNDGSNGEPAYQEFNDSGKVIAVERYKDGDLNDSWKGEPAVQNFNDSGILTHAEYYRNNRRNDGVNGDPAFQVFNDDGILILAMRYKNDMLTAALSAEEMKTYQEKKNAASKTATAPEKPARKKCLLKRIFHRRHH
jgi:antitoxin component YwqK of YwqJK toxin-antitoxin module